MVSYAMLASDRYHYLHHLHVLYSSTAWLCIAPLDDRASLRRFVRRARSKWGNRRDKGILDEPRTRPIWPLQLLRGHVVGIYTASRLAKLQSSWLSGDTLRDLHAMNVVGGSLWTFGERSLGIATMARSVCFVELALPVLLVLPWSRRCAVLLGWSFHALISSTMGVSTFGVEMAILLVAFWQNADGEDGWAAQMTLCTRDA